VKLDGDAGAAVGGAGSGWPSETIVTFFRTTGVTGLSFASFSTRAIVLTTLMLASSHWPKIVWC
jgi:hypothetical protein